MGQTPTFALPYPEPADPADVPTDMHELCTRLEQVIGALPVVPVGAIVDWPYASGGIPVWALLCYGQAISRTSYAALHTLAAAAAYPHGAGDGTATFALPDLRGRVAAGKDDMGGAAANRITAAVSGSAGTVLGVAVGNEGVAITTAQLPAHNHGVTGAPSFSGSITAGPAGIGIAAAGTGVTVQAGGNHTHALPAGQIFGTGGGFYSNYSQAAGGQLLTTTALGYPGDHGHGISDPTHGHGVYDGPHSHSHTFGVGVGSLGTSNTGGAGVHMSTQPTLIVNKMMRAL